MKTLAELKRHLIVGREIDLIFSNNDTTRRRRKVVKVQSNGIYVTSVENGNMKKWLDFPKASLLEISDKGFKIFCAGKRPLNEKEKGIIKGYEQIRDKKQEEIDALSDGSTSYWQQKRYFEKNNSLYLLGEYQNGMRFNSTYDLVEDSNIKGDLILEYEFV